MGWALPVGAGAPPLPLVYVIVGVPTSMTPVTVHECKSQYRTPSVADAPAIHHAVLLVSIDFHLPHRRPFFGVPSTVAVLVVVEVKPNLRRDLPLALVGEVDPFVQPGDGPEAHEDLFHDEHERDGPAVHVLHGEVVGDHR